MTWQTLEALRRASLMIIAIASTLLSEALFTVPGQAQAGIPFAGVFPWAWGAVAASFAAATFSSMTKVEPVIWGHRASTVLAMVGTLIIAAAAGGRGIAWAIDSERGIWGSRSVWSIWFVMCGLSAAILVLTFRLMKESDDGRQDDTQ